MNSIRVRCTLEVPYRLLKPMLQQKFPAEQLKAFLTGYLVSTDIRVSRVAISNHDVKKEGGK